MIIVIDDERTFNFRPFTPTTHYARTSDEGIMLILKSWLAYMNRMGEAVDILYLDHDLGEDDDIHPVVEFLYTMGKTAEGFTIFIQNIEVHSQNPTSGWIVSNLGMAGFKRVERVPLPPLKS